MTSAQDEIARQQAIDADDKFSRANPKLMDLVKIVRELQVAVADALMESWNASQSDTGPLTLAQAEKLSISRVESCGDCKFTEPRLIDCASCRLSSEAPRNESATVPNRVSTRPVYDPNQQKIDRVSNHKLCASLVRCNKTSSECVGCNCNTSIRNESATDHPCGWHRASPHGPQCGKAFPGAQSVACSVPAERGRGCNTFREKESATVHQASPPPHIHDEKIRNESAKRACSTETDKEPVNRQEGTSSPVDSHEADRPEAGTLERAIWDKADPYTWPDQFRSGELHDMTDEQILDVVRSSESLEISPGYWRIQRKSPDAAKEVTP